MARRKKKVMALLGFAAAGVFAILFVLRIQEKGEVAQLVDVLSGKDPAEVAWAFENLKALDDSQLWHLLPHLESSARTTLKHMARSDEHCNGTIVGPRDPDVFLVGQVALFLLSTRLTGYINIRQPDPGGWEAALKSKGLPSGTLPEKVASFFRWPERILLPSAAPPSRERVPTGDTVDGLLSVLTGKDRADAAWALETLRTLPDDRVDALLDSVMSQEHVPLDSLSWVSDTGSTSLTLPNGCTLGQVVRHLLCTRIGLVRSDGKSLISNKLWNDGIVSQEDADTLIECWRAHIATTR